MLPLKLLGTVDMSQAMLDNSPQLKRLTSIERVQQSYNHIVACLQYQKNLQLILKYIKKKKNTWTKASFMHFCLLLFLFKNVIIKHHILRVLTTLKC